MRVRFDATFWVDGLDPSKEVSDEAARGAIEGANMMFRLALSQVPDLPELFLDAVEITLQEIDGDRRVGRARVDFPRAPGVPSGDASPPA